MSDRRTDASPRSTWITMDRDAHDSQSGDSESDGTESRVTALSVLRDRHQLRGSAAEFLRSYNRNDLMRMRRHYQISGLEELDDNEDEDEEGQQVMFFPESFTSEDLSDEEMHARMNVLHEDEEEDERIHIDSEDEEEEEDDSSHEDSDDDEAENTNDEEEDESSQYSAGNAMASFENLPSLNGTQPPHRGSTESKAKTFQSFIPKYLESTAYGTLYHRMLDQHKHDSDSATDGSSSTVMGAESESDLMVPHVAPDMFFKTLVQESWPHYCTPVATMPSFASLGFGLGVNESIYPVVPSTSSDSTQSRRGGLGDDSRTSWRARLVAPNSANGSVPSRQQNSRVVQAQRRQAAATTKKDEKESEQAQLLPSAWTTVRPTPNLDIAPNRETVKYTGPGRHDTDASMILTDVCIPSRTGVYYYEVYIKSRGQNGYIGIGLARSGLVATRLPGWDPGSWGYHGDDGHVFGGAGSGTRYGPRYSTGDTVGCGIDFMKRRIFFTRNGVFLGHVFDVIDITKDLFPCVGMRTPGEHLVANFGRKPFVFDISAYVTTAQEDAIKATKTAELGKLLPTHKQMEKDSNDTFDMGGILALRGGLASGVQAKISEGDAILSIVLMHLLHNEYYGTARALIENAIGQHGLDSWSPQLAPVLQLLSQQDEQRVSRRRICKHIHEGDIDHALGMLQDVYPRVLDDESLVFQLRCRQFIELVRLANGHHIASNVPDDNILTPPLPQTSNMMDVDDSQSPTMLSLSAITNATPCVQTKYGQLGSLSKMDPAQLVRVLLEYGRQLQADYGSSSNAVIREGLVHTFSLLAYSDPEQSPVAALLDPSARGPLARLVEMAVMAMEKTPRVSELECICRQTSTALSELSKRRNGAATLISVERDVLRASTDNSTESR
ncbi:hypothetical protein J3B01_001107 [Coemansia erecta]|nr:hypothetical protein J3B01_001107 [Coemansia erecta]